MVNTIDMRLVSAFSRKKNRKTTHLFSYIQKNKMILIRDKYCIHSPLCGPQTASKDAAGKVGCHKTGPLPNIEMEKQKEEDCQRPQFNALQVFKFSQMFNIKNYTSMRLLLQKVSKLRLISHETTK